MSLTCRLLARVTTRINNHLDTSFTQRLFEDISCINILSDMLVTCRLLEHITNRINFHPDMQLTCCLLECITTHTGFRLIARELQASEWTTYSESLLSKMNKYVIQTSIIRIKVSEEFYYSIQTIYP